MDPITLAVLLMAVVLVCAVAGLLLVRTSLRRIKYSEVSSISGLDQLYAGAGLVVWLLGAAIALHAAYTAGWIA